MPIFIFFMGKSWWLTHVDIDSPVGFPINGESLGISMGFPMNHRMFQYFPMGFPIKPVWASPPNTSCAGASVSQLKLCSDLHWKVVGAFPKLPFERRGISPNSTAAYMGKWSTNGGFSIDMGLSENVVYPEKPNGFADHYPVSRWLFHWGYTPFSDIPICESSNVIYDLGLGDAILSDQPCSVFQGLRHWQSPEHPRQKPYFRPGTAGESRPSQSPVSPDFPFEINSRNHLESEYIIVLYHIKSYNIISYYIISNRIIWYYIILYNIMTYHLILLSSHLRLYPIKAYSFISYHIMSCHIIILHDMIWYDMIWYHVI